MRTSALATAAIVAVLAISPAAARDRGQGLVIDVKPRSWLDPGTVTYPGKGLGYVTNTAAFGGGPVNGITSRTTENLPPHGISGRGYIFEFLGANMAR